MPKFVIQKWPFYNHFWQFYFQLYTYLLQNWDPNSHFEVFNLSGLEVSPSKDGDTSSLDLNWSKNYMWYKTQIVLFLVSSMKLTKTDESVKHYFPEISWITFDKIIVQYLVYFILKAEIRICQKIRTKVTKTISILSKFFGIRL